MTTHPLRFLTALLLCLACLSGCHKPPSETNEQQADKSYTADEQARASKLIEVRDPIEEEIYKFRIDTRQAYNNRRFDELEKIAAPLRASQALFRDGSWKIAQFYQSLECRPEEPEDMWQLHE